MKKIFTLCLALLASGGVNNLAFANDDFWKDHSTGWHWYKDSNKEKALPAQNPIQIVEQIQQQTKQALDQAILNPTVENITTYIAMQNQISAQSQRFAESWQATLLQYPELNYSLQHPTNSLGKQVYLDQKRKEEDLAIAQLVSDSGLFFFYRSSCPYCQRFAPILKAFALQYGISVVAITTDGIPLSEFPNSMIDKGQAQLLHITAEPAVFTVDPYTKQIIPIGYGLMSEDELRQRILVVARAFNTEKLHEKES